MIDIFGIVGEFADGVVINGVFIYVIVKVNKTLGELSKAINELIVHNQTEHNALMHTTTATKSYTMPYPNQQPPRKG